MCRQNNYNNVNLSKANLNYPYFKFSKLSLPKMMPKLFLKFTGIKGNLQLKY